MKIQNCKVHDFDLDFFSWSKDGKVPAHEIYLAVELNLGIRTVQRVQYFLIDLIG